MRLSGKLYSLIQIKQDVPNEETQAMASDRDNDSAEYINPPQRGAIMLLGVFCGRVPHGHRRLNCWFAQGSKVSFYALRSVVEMFRNRLTAQAAREIAFSLGALVARSTSVVPVQLLALASCGPLSLAFVTGLVLPLPFSLVLEFTVKYPRFFCI